MQMIETVRNTCTFQYICTESAFSFTDPKNLGESGDDRQDEPNLGVDKKKDEASTEGVKKFWGKVRMNYRSSDRVMIINTIITISHPWQRDTGKHAAQGPNIMSPEAPMMPPEAPMMPPEARRAELEGRVVCSSS